MKRGFGTILVVIAIVCIVLGAAGAYLAILHPSQKPSLFDSPQTSSVPVASSPNPPSAPAPTPVSTSTSDSKKTATGTASTMPTGEVPATISVQTNYKGNPLRVLATCSVRTSTDVYGFAFYPGDTSVQFDGSINPTPKVKTIDFTYKAPGTYVLECLPSYLNAKINSIAYLEAYGAKKTISIGGYVTPSKTNMTFTFSPTAGILPLQIKTACSVKTTGTVTALAIGVDDPNQMDIAGGETFTDKYVLYDLDSSGAGVNNSDSFTGTLAASKYWRGDHNVFCMAYVNNTTPIISNPIPVHFQ